MSHISQTVPELLAPAGSPEAFRAALAAGADAIYCGLGNDLNARRGANNFDDKNFEAACRLAHLAGVRVYVTINVVIKQQELTHAAALIARAYELGADAFIIQDWGLLKLVRSLWPQIECHISTQANVHDARATAWCAELGATRVTLSRELPLEEIAACAATGVEVETFAHGAICICYSGVCLFSSMSGGRSANRGMCAQPCRLPYDLVDSKGNAVQAPGQDRPLCPKDAAMLEDVAALTAAGAGSLKIEGRMKAPDYVYSVVSAYRAQLDDVAAGIAPGEKNLVLRWRTLERAFNRGLTNGYLHHIADSRLMSYERSNNRGQFVGEVLLSRKLPDVIKNSRGKNGGRERKRVVTRAEVTLRLSEPVGAGDLLELRPKDAPSTFLTAHVAEAAVAGQTITVIAPRPMPKGCPVRLIRSQAALDAAEQVQSLDYPRRRPVLVQIRCKLGEPFEVMLSTLDGTAQASATGPVVEAARSKELTEADVIEHVCRMGTTPFSPASTTIELDGGCGMGFSAIHKVRAQAAVALEREILAPYQLRLANLAAAPRARELDVRLAALTRAQAAGCSSGEEVELCVIAPTPELAQAAQRLGAARVYVPSDELGLQEFPSGCIPLLDEVCRECDHERLDAYVVPGAPVAAGNVSELVQASRVGARAELRSTIPLHNKWAIRAMEAAGACGIWLSPELTLGEIDELAGFARVPVGAVVYGRTRVMTTEHCVLQAAAKCKKDCAHCPERARHLGIKNIDGEVYPVRTDLHMRSRIYASRVQDLIPQVGALVSSGVTRLCVDATLLDEQELAQELDRVRRALAGKKLEREAGATAGHLFEGIA